MSLHANKAKGGLKKIFEKLIHDKAEEIKKNNS